MIVHTVAAGLLWLAAAQAGPLTIDEAVTFAETNYPAIRAARAGSHRRPV